MNTWCPMCGPGVAVDEDGCCTSCGSTAMGEGADEALEALAEVGHRRSLERCPECGGKQIVSYLTRCPKCCPEEESDG